jgi:hypothetical protein
MKRENGTIQTISKSVVAVDSVPAAVVWHRAFENIYWSYKRATG